VSQEPVSTNSKLPEDIAARLDKIIDRYAATLRKEVGNLFRFANMDEVPAAVELLKERQHPMPVDEIVSELMAGGIWREATGSKGSSAAGEMRRSISQAARHGVNLKYVDREKEIIGLP
jgi:hypothetical protein